MFGDCTIRELEVFMSMDAVALICTGDVLA